jgi:hypothetical protein
MARGIFYLLLAVCVVGMLRFVLAIRAGIRRRQQSHRLERGTAECLRQIAAKKVSSMGNG